MRLNTFKIAGIIAVITVIGLISVLSNLFLPSSTYVLSVIIAISTIVIGCIGIIVITYQDVKYGEILKKSNVKRCLKEHYKLMIFMVIYTTIMFNVFIFVEFIYALIILGIVLVIAGIAIICIEICFRMSIRKLESDE